MSHPQYIVVPYALSPENQRIYDMLKEIADLLKGPVPSSDLYMYVYAMMHALGKQNDVRAPIGCMMYLEKQIPLKQRLESNKINRAETGTRLKAVVNALHAEYKAKYPSG
jgi:hypothetical protein